MIFSWRAGRTASWFSHRSHRVSFGALTGFPLGVYRLPALVCEHRSRGWFSPSPIPVPAVRGRGHLRGGRGMFRVVSLLLLLLVVFTPRRGGGSQRRAVG